MRSGPKFQSALLLLGILLAGAILPPCSQATTARVAALGGAGDYFEDEAGSLRWYGSLGDYPDAVTLDFGQFNIYNGYHGDLGETISAPSLSARYNLGARWGQVAGWWHGHGTDGSSGEMQPNNLDDTFTLLYGRRVGPVQLGLSYRYGEGSHHNRPGSYYALENLSQGQQWGFGARVDISPSAYLDVAGDLRSREEEFSFVHDNDDPYEYSLESKEGYALRSRLFLQLGERTALVPVAEYNSEVMPDLFDGRTLYPALDGQLLRLGCAVNFFPDSDRFFFFSGEWNDGRISDTWGDEIVFPTLEWQYDWSTFTLLAGWEGRALPWLVTRLAVGFQDNQVTSEGGDGPYDSWESYSELFFSAGIGAHLGPWNLDAALSDQQMQPVFGHWGPSKNAWRISHLRVTMRSDF